MAAISADEQGYRPPSQCETGLGVLTLYPRKQDHENTLSLGWTDTGALLSSGDFTSHIFSCGLRNVSQAQKVLVAQGCVALFCSQQGDMGRVFGQ